ncbi:very short patch repair endonuclease [Pseudomonas aeruginosa]|uniref:very short patch repair endonuclease n=1 Tax=Pseudomonas aeruginosa TaxID=287 RepID=UPI002F90B7F3
MADNMTPEQRRMTMSRIRGRDTKVELVVRKELHRRGYRFRVNATWLTGKPDIVFTRFRLAIFIDGDFWHGWKFDQWSLKLAPYWREKIGGNITRDLRHRALLRREGWTVMRLWEHDVNKNLDRCIRRIEAKLDQLRKV